MQGFFFDDSKIYLENKSALLFLRNNISLTQRMDQNGAAAWVMLFEQSVHLTTFSKILIDSNNISLSTKYLKTGGLMLQNQIILEDHSEFRMLNTLASANTSNGRCEFFVLNRGSEAKNHSVFQFSNTHFSANIGERMDYVKINVWSLDFYSFVRFENHDLEIISAKAQVVFTRGCCTDSDHQSNLLWNHSGMYFQANTGRLQVITGQKSSHFKFISEQDQGMLLENNSTFVVADNNIAVQHIGIGYFYVNKMSPGFRNSSFIVARNRWSSYPTATFCCSATSFIHGNWLKSSASNALGFFDHSQVIIEDNQFTQQDTLYSSCDALYISLENLQLHDYSRIVGRRNAIHLVNGTSASGWYLNLEGTKVSHYSYVLVENEEYRMFPAPWQPPTGRTRVIWMFSFITWTTVFEDHSFLWIRNLTGEAVSPNGTVVGFQWGEDEEELQLTVTDHSYVLIEQVHFSIDFTVPAEAKFTIANFSHLTFQDNYFKVNASEYESGKVIPQHSAIGMRWGSYTQWYGALLYLQEQSIFAIKRTKLEVYCGSHSPCIGLLAPVINITMDSRSLLPSWVHIASNDIKLVNALVPMNNPGTSYFNNASKYAGQLASCLNFPPYNVGSGEIYRPSDRFSNFYPNGILTISEINCSWKYTVVTDPSPRQEKQSGVPIWLFAFNGSVVPFTNVTEATEMTTAVLARQRSLEDPQFYHSAKNSELNNLEFRCTRIQGSLREAPQAVASFPFVSNLNVTSLKDLVIESCNHCSVEIDCMNFSFQHVWGTAPNQCRCVTTFTTSMSKTARSFTSSGTTPLTESPLVTSSDTRVASITASLTETPSVSASFSQSVKETRSFTLTLSDVPSETYTVSGETLSVTETAETPSWSSSHSMSLTKTLSDETRTISPTPSELETQTQSVTQPTLSAASPSMSQTSSIEATHIVVQPTSFGSLSGANLDFRVQGNHFRVLDINGSVVSNPLRQQQIINSLLANVTSNQSFLFLPKDCFNVTVRPQNREMYRLLPEILAHSGVSIRVEMVEDAAEAWRRESYFWDYILQFHVIPLPRIIQPEFLVFTFNAFCFNTQTLLQIVEGAMDDRGRSVRIPRVSDTIEMVVMVAVQQRNVPDVSKEAEKDADTSVSTTTFTSLFAGASAADAVEAERILGLIEALKCDYVFGEKLPFRSHPFGNPIGDNERLRYFFGATIMNPIFMFLCMMAFFLLCQAYRKSPVPKKPPQYDYLTFFGFCGAVEFPSRCLVIVFFLMQDTIQSTMIVVIHADMTENKIMKGISVLILLAWIAFAVLIVLLNTIYFHAQYNVYERIVVAEEKLKEVMMRAKQRNAEKEEESKCGEEILLEKLLADAENDNKARRGNDQEAAATVHEVKEAYRKLRWVLRMDGQGNWNDSESHRIDDEKPKGEDKPKGLAILHTLHSRMYICTHRHYRPGRHWFFALELLFVFFFALLGAIRPTKNCDFILLGTAAGFGVYTIVNIALHPIAAHVKQWKSGTSGFLQFSSSAAMLIGKLSHTPAIVTAGSYIAMGAMYFLSSITAVFVIWKMHRFRKMLKMRKQKYIRNVQKDNELWAERQKKKQQLEEEDQDEGEGEEGIEEMVNMEPISKADMSSSTTYKDEIQPGSKPEECTIFLGPFDTENKLYELQGAPLQIARTRLHTFYNIYNPAEATGKVEKALQMDATEDEIMKKLFRKYNVPVDELQAAASERATRGAEQIKSSSPPQAPKIVAEKKNEAQNKTSKAKQHRRKSRKPPELQLAAPPVLLRGTRDRRPTGGPGGLKPGYTPWWVVRPNEEDERADSLSVSLLPPDELGPGDEGHQHFHFEELEDTGTEEVELGGSHTSVSSEEWLEVLDDDANASDYSDEYYF